MHSRLGAYQVKHSLHEVVSGLRLNSQGCKLGNRFMIVVERVRRVKLSKDFGLFTPEGQIDNLKSMKLSKPMYFEHNFNAKKP